MLEGEPEHALRGLPGDELDTLHDSVHNDVLNARVLALGVFSDEDEVNIVVRSLVAFD